ncbi:unnamed protein product [Ranitomeya imitator]|uniref:C-type lectin domain-containing protein n=1 Tax=Ranitomeya imitator TaxID=111125 RepID=A0ABN9M6K5_9NEOB|nr:unnamed protein product [Ranitomeya imitator]
MAFGRIKCSFPFVTLFNTNKIICPSKINLSKPISPLNLSKQIRKQRQGVLEFDRDLIKKTIIYTGSQGAILLSNKKETRSHEITETKIDKSAPCDDDWIWYRGKCYYFSTARDTWGNSEKFCHSHNSSLAIIESKEELDFLFRHKDLDHHWIGMRRTDDNTAWTWTDGTSYNESLFKIKRTSQENIEHVFLNSGNVGSEGGNFHFKWICNKR